MENNLFIPVRSMLTAFGGSVRFNRPPQLDREGNLLLGAGFHRGNVLVHLGGPKGDRYVHFPDLEDSMAEAVVAILRRCLVPENIRLTIGDIVKVNRLEDPFYGVITDTGGLVHHVDCRGCLVDKVPVIVLFGTDDFEVTGHREFTQAILEQDTPAEAYAELKKEISLGHRLEVFRKTYPFPGGGSAYEKAHPVEGADGYVVEYNGIEALVCVRINPDGSTRASLHPDYAWMSDEGEVKISTAK